MKEKNSDIFKNVNENELISKFSQLENFKKKAHINNNARFNSPYSNSKDILNFLREKNKISEKNYNFLFKNLTEDSTLDNKLNSINHYLTKDDLSVEERKQIEIVKSIFVSSNEYWKKSANAKAAIDGDKRKERSVIVADAIGALIWWETGP
ncbi:hypothetical protein GNY06_08650 [Elizabethkingia argentiflava]|uniref:Uncharacterized protein n=1 Tax=Elizabethkingia argenteiflava TaxID=2681556 RepID=A0A845PX63_9FLAO|nr:hypothetical protein [Elizabethkingia argenteiflava]NAW51446.1 hypothetical protein [Elizabethkingia argenteiflava]